MIYQRASSARFLRVNPWGRLLLLFKLNFTISHERISQVHAHCKPCAVFYLVRLVSL